MGRFELTASMLSGAKRPWASDEALPSHTVRPIESPSAPAWEIQACLHCPYPECIDCMYAWKNAMANIRYDHRPKKERGRHASV